ncbi:pyridoxamine 5'-phosphate oxidase family protein [Marinobacterium rhizophilum]|uniref:Pyridoxamine 5'-phosphate oxidase family protein n=1 Tax=Marinobacterium rhizophilum TaxID=420402 RepID=A0ABY5HK48_9GAMM|nr:pyridoxamine 5'-phosphate oxidase family protein [Marinobacterium rhizophilum]UTW12668.1 pyridoxamine 5'-phosphate oxidase family protein [Marinobacterium rhizophilum]
MGHKFADIAFTPRVRALQRDQGSRDSYARMEQGADNHHRLGPREADFIAARDSFYMASVTETGWPYVQHRGGPAGFVRVLDDRHIGFADFKGNRQYISTGNFRSCDRVALIMVDYPNRARLKLLGRVRELGEGEPDQLAALAVADYGAGIERGFVIELQAFDWNCPQHLVPRYSAEELARQLDPLREENRRLRAIIAGYQRNA